MKILTIATVLFLYTSAVAVPDCYSNCFEIVAGECPTLVFTENRDVQIKIESYATDAHGWWTVSDASVTGNIVFAFCDNCAFADSPNLVNVTIPQSVKRICARSFYENCPSLTSVSVPYATIIEGEAFPPGCTVTRYGPNIDVYISAPWWKKVDEETKIALMRTLDLQDYESAETPQYLQNSPPRQFGAVLVAGRFLVTTKSNESPSIRSSARQRLKGIIFQTFV